MYVLLLLVTPRSSNLSRNSMRILTDCRDMTVDVSETCETRMTKLRQTREPTECDPGGGGLVVNPEGDPGEHDDQDGRQVGLEHEVADVPLQLEAQRQALVLPCIQTVWVVYFIIQYYILE